MEKREPSYTIVSWCSHCGKQYKVTQKIKNRDTIWPSNSTVGYISKKMETIIQKDIYTPMFIAALFTAAKIWKQPKHPSTNERIKRMWYVCIDIAIHTCMLVPQSCPTLCGPMDYSPPGSSVHGILQARILGWAAVSFPRGSSWPRNWT